MYNFEDFTLAQKDTFTKVKDLNKKLKETVDATSFVLNPEVQKIRKELEEEQSKCNHVWDDKGVCYICGKTKPEPITFFSTHCPKCKVLETKLKQKNIDYVENDSVEDMEKLGLKFAPALLVNGDELLDFSAAIKWVNAQEA